MVQDVIITIPISEIGTPPQYHFHIEVNGKVVASNQTLPSADAEAVRNISNQYNELFEDRCIPQLSTETQATLGRDLFNLWLAPNWNKIKPLVPAGSRRILVIASQVPAVLNLPWELLLPPEGEFLGINPLFSIRRLPRADKLAVFKGDLRPRPLRVLFMACAPTNQAPLDYELEEEYLLKAVSGEEMAFDSGDLGTFDELCQRVNSFQPHIVHLTGHGIVKNNEGWFCFENESVQTDLRSSKEISLKLAGCGVQCIFVSGCQIGKSPPVDALGGVCQGLVGHEIPLALGWAVSIADDLATRFARTFYGTLASSQPVDRALILARQALWERCKNKGNPSWTLPMLYSSTTQDLIFDPDLERKREEPARSTIVQQPLPGMKEGYAEHFVGRRREQQRLIPALRDGKLQMLIISGLGGSGKSTLATRLARKMETEGFTLIPVPSSRKNPLDAGRLIDTCIEAFRCSADKYKSIGEVRRSNELEAVCERLENAQISVKARLHQIVAILNAGRFLIVLDNFESNQDVDSRAILDDDIADFYKHLATNLSGKSRAIITTRYLPADLPIPPPGVEEELLGDFKEAAFIKILRRDETVEHRYRLGELPLDLLMDLYQKFGGTPRFLLQMREAI
jgi:hypothetical protein